MADVTTNGVRLHVQRLGRGGRPVVFIHGLVMDNLSSWYFTAATKVALSAEVILYDLRGHGRSERPPSGYAVETFVDDLAGLLDALEVRQPAALVGNSFGGLLAVAFAARYPDRVERLALVDAHFQAEGWAQAMAETLSLTGPARDAKIAESFSSWLGRHSERKRNRLAEAAQSLVYGTTLLDDLQQAPTLSALDLQRIACPVLALYGEQSDIRSYGQHLADTLAHCELRLFSGGSHSILWEATAEVCQQLVSWLAQPGIGGPGGRASRAPEVG